MLVFSAQLVAPTPSFAKPKAGGTDAKASPAPAAPSEEILPENFRCEKFHEKSLAALKLKLIENCDLNRPYSASMSHFMQSEAYMYCCHGKK